VAKLGLAAMQQTKRSSLSLPYWNFHQDFAKSVYLAVKHARCVQGTTDPKARVRGGKMPFSPTPDNFQTPADRLLETAQRCGRLAALVTDRLTVARLLEVAKK
jgi:hypothetical protein